jgi:hypothetical protein
MKNLVEHAKEELKKAGIDPHDAVKILDMIRIFADTRPSGTSGEIMASIVTDLMAHKNLTPLTDDPSEWVHYGEEMWGERGGIWQNTRNPKAFSRDRGKHYWLLEDRPNEAGIKQQYTSQKSKE